MAEKEVARVHANFYVGVVRASLGGGDMRDLALYTFVCDDGERGKGASVSLPRGTLHPSFQRSNGVWSPASLNLGRVTDESAIGVVLHEADGTPIDATVVSVGQLLAADADHVVGEQWIMMSGDVRVRPIRCAAFSAESWRSGGRVGACVVKVLVT